MTATDETGMARVRIRVTALAPNQTALLQVTDLATGAFRRASFAIAQFNGNTPAFFTLPSSITLSGPSTAACSTGSAEVAVFGGTPPYIVIGHRPRSPSASTVSPRRRRWSPRTAGSSRSTSRAPASAWRTCPIAVTDATGRTLTVTVTNKFGTAAPPIAPCAELADPALRPERVARRIVGGAEPFSAGSSDGLLLVTAPGRAGRSR